jgi:hypothetical protein
MSALVGISLRGTLASIAAIQTADSDDPQRALAAFIEGLLSRLNKDVLHRFEQGTLVLGLRSELGLFPPDW